MKRLLSHLKQSFYYLKLPGMRVVWIFWPAALALTIVELIYLRGPWAWVNTLVLLTVGALLSAGEYKSTVRNFRQDVSYGRLESIVTNLEDAVVTYDNNFKILIFNSAAERLFNLSKEKILGQTVGPERVGEPSMKLLVQVLFPSLAPTVVGRSEPNQFPQVVDISFTDPVRELRVSTDRILGRNSQLLGFVKVIQDRTREVRLVKSKSEFVSVAAHQLRTPLTAINWTLEGLVKNTQLTEEDRQLVENGLKAAANLLKTVNDLLDTAEIEEGKFGYKLEEIDLVGFINNILENAQVVAKQHGLQLFFDKGNIQSLKVKVDQSKLGLAVSNLIDNALKYNSKNGSVTVRVKQMADKPYVQISVQDTGVGIPPGDVDKLFQKFFRAPNARKIKADGTGLGLYITKNIINQHGGTIWVESTLGRGTTFHFTLPTDPSLIPRAESLNL